jgi:hypothetical protein
MGFDPTKFSTVRKQIEVLVLAAYVATDAVGRANRAAHQVQIAQPARTVLGIHSDRPYVALLADGPESSHPQQRHGATGVSRSWRPPLAHVSIHLSDRRSNSSQ